MKPNESTMIGTWIPDKSESTCPPGMSIESIKLVLEKDGKFQAENFPKELSFGRQAMVFGNWALEKDGEKWKLSLPWETPSKSILDGAKLIEKSNAILIEFWIGDPDLCQRLVLKRQK